MKKEISFILALSVLSFFLLVSNVSAFSPNAAAFTRSAMKAVGQFGGEIISPKALEIMELEAMGFVCQEYGTSISIVPIGSPSGTPTSYFIPPWITSRTSNVPMPGQLIIGKYLGSTTIPCISPSVPPFITAVPLTNIILFGNSLGI